MRRWLIGALLAVALLIGVAIVRGEQGDGARPHRAAVTVPVRPTRRVRVGRPQHRVRHHHRVVRAVRPLRLPARLPGRSVRLLILMYHRIDRTT
ncbi:MAG: hypothetical protein ABI317_09310, partial [Gaiellales bacterium]